MADIIRSSTPPPLATSPNVNSAAAAAAAAPTASATQSGGYAILPASAADTSAADTPAVDAVDNNNNIPSSEMILDAKPTANRDVSTAAAAAPAISTTQSVMGLLFCPLQPSIRYFGSNTHCYGCVDADENSNNMTTANRVIPAQ